MKNIKNELRKEMIKRRNEINNVEKTTMDNKIIETFINTIEYKKCKQILIYIGFGSEINTKKLIEYALEDGKEVYVPKVIKEDMVFIRINNLENLVTSNYGILEPIGDKSDFNVDKLGIVIMPGVAFDKHGNRIGYGGGYYDKFLNNNVINGKKIALLYSFQIIDSIPREEHDIKVDSLITEEKLIEINNK
ncbi:MAG: 5-formyltetrahydrofolate cyclo-ligase [Clostridium sp.]|uniref:5-formyltetrahydrofolate cyclo-ligase n=1 Tax=Clostridium sp. TaxID=1506 RepID=UPI003F34BD28